MEDSLDEVGAEADGAGKLLAGKGRPVLPQDFGQGEALDLGEFLDRAIV